MKIIISKLHAFKWKNEFVFLNWKKLTEWRLLLYAALMDPSPREEVTALWEGNLPASFPDQAWHTPLGGETAQCSKYLLLPLSRGSWFTWEGREEVNLSPYAFCCTLTWLRMWDFNQNSIPSADPIFPAASDLIYLPDSAHSDNYRRGSSNFWHIFLKYWDWYISSITI